MSKLHIALIAIASVAVVFYLSKLLASLTWVWATGGYSKKAKLWRTYRAQSEKTGKLLEEALKAQQKWAASKEEEEVAQAAWNELNRDELKALEDLNQARSVTPATRSAYRS